MGSFIQRNFKHLKEVIVERLRWSRPDCFSHKGLSEQLLVKEDEPWLSRLQFSMYSNTAITETEQGL